MNTSEDASNNEITCIQHSTHLESDIVPPSSNHKSTNWKIVFLFSGLVLANAFVWIVSVSVYIPLAPSAVSSLVVAFTLGLRHALDADHIAAIDNTTRRFLMTGETPVTIGLFFSLGHSTIVVLATIVIAIVANTLFVDRYSQISSVIGSSISASFLLLIAIINFISIHSIVVQMKALRQSDEHEDVKIDGGFFYSLFGEKFFRLIDRPWKLYFVGFLFGLGFDTSTEIALLSVVVINAVSSSSAWLVVFLSLLFTCGMTLVDSIDSVLMLKVYGWSVVSPLQKLHFNLFITTLSVIFALGIALIEILAIIQSQCSLEGPFWDLVSTAGDNFEFIGIFIASSFILSFLVALISFKLNQKYKLTKDYKP